MAHRVFDVIEGCNALLKNKAGQRARRLAAASGHRSTASACRRAQRKRSASAGQLWAVKLYDFCSERKSTLLDLLSMLDHEETGLVPSSVFLQVANFNTPLSIYHWLLKYALKF